MSKIRTIIDKESKKRTNQLRDDLFDELAEAVGGVLVVDVLDQLGDDLRVRFRFECVALLLQQRLDVLQSTDNKTQIT